MRGKNLLPLLLFCATLCAQAEESSCPGFQERNEPDSDYCVGIRGNGESIAAHWGALSRMIEERGMPKATAGGSSATITMFLLDGLSGNSKVNSQPDAKKKLMQGLLVKSMPEFITVMAHSAGLSSVYAFEQEMNKNNSDVRKSLTDLYQSGDAPTAAEIKNAYGEYGSLVNPELMRDLETHPEFFKGEALDGLKYLGAFDAANDKNLFFRPAVIDPKYFAIVMGRMADFYAGNTDDATQAALEKFAENCAVSSRGKQWQDLPDSACKQRFDSLVSNYLNQGKFQDKLLFQKVGTNLPSTPATAVLQGNSLSAYQSLKASYESGNAKTDYSQFHADFSDIKFGYWGDPPTLKNINQGLDPLREQGDLKAEHFKPLGDANWFEVLSTSPAEPGLANFQKIPIHTSRAQVLAELQKPESQRWLDLKYRKGLLSAGGWSDLYPTEVLKAEGCKNTVYVTRTGGDTVFGQQVFIRLTGTEAEIPFWKNIADQNNSGWNVAGTPAEDTPWNHIQNYGNPDSSYNRAIRDSSAIYCTDWDAYNVFGGQMWPMVEQSYCSPVYEKAGSPISLEVNAPDHVPNQAKDPGCVPFRPKNATTPLALPAAEPAK